MVHRDGAVGVRGGRRANLGWRQMPATGTQPLSPQQHARLSSTLLLNFPSLLFSLCFVPSCGR